MDIVSGLILLLQGVMLIVMWFGRNTLPKYLGQKAENLATKQDIEEITRKIESVKVNLNKIDRINEKKYQIKYDACLTMFEIVDAQLSHVMFTDNDGNPITPDKQYVTQAKVRQCHNELIITIDNNEIIECFLKLVVGNMKSPTQLLDNLRQLVREELGFGDVAYQDETSTWLGIVSFKEPAE